LPETFVDISRFQGTCCKAATWIFLGMTQGFGKSAKRYYHHGRPKAISVRSLHKRAIRRLTDPIANPKLIRKIGHMKFTKKQFEDLIDIPRSLKDPQHN